MMQLSGPDVTHGGRPRRLLSESFDTLQWDRPYATDAPDHQTQQQSVAVPSQRFEIAAHNPFPLRSSLKRNILKPTKKAAEVAMCWLLDIEYDPKQPVPADARDPAPGTTQADPPQHHPGPTARAMSAAFNGITCRRFSMDDEIDSEVEVVHPTQAAHEHAGGISCSTGGLSVCRRPQFEAEAAAATKPSRGEVDRRTLEDLVANLFRLHDLNKNGVLEEAELVQLNKKVAMLHSGKDVDKAAVTEKYQNLFRTRFDPSGEPIPYPTFAKYMYDVLDDIDTDVRAQIMIMEQFILEADTARKFFRIPSFESKLDAPFLRFISFDESTFAPDDVGILEELPGPTKTSPHGL